MARLFDDGSSEYLEVASAVVSAAPLSISLWVYNDDLTARDTALSITDQSWSDAFMITLFGDVAGDLVRFYTVAGGSDAAAITTSGMTINTWHHIVGVEVASNSRAVYIDGGSKGTNSTDLTPAGLSHTALGIWDTGGTTQPWSGRIAEVAIWNVALTDAEVAILAEGYSPLFVRPQNLVAYWPLIRDEDQDRVGGYDLTAYNTPSVAVHSPVIYPAPPFVFVAPSAGVAYALPMAMDLYRFRRV